MAKQQNSILICKQGPLRLYVTACWFPFTLGAMISSPIIIDQIIQFGVTETVYTILGMLLLLQFILSILALPCLEFWEIYEDKIVVKGIFKTRNVVHFKDLKIIKMQRFYSKLHYEDFYVFDDGRKFCMRRGGFPLNCKNRNLYLTKNKKTEKAIQEINKRLQLPIEEFIVQTSITGL